MSKRNKKRTKSAKSRKSAKRAKYPKDKKGSATAGVPVWKPRPFNSGLSEDQAAAVSAVEDQVGPFFLTGQAGSGKSFVINYLRGTYPKSVVTAMTGAAAQLINGRTLHSFASIHPHHGVVRSKGADARVRACNLLIIDEISMASLEVMSQLHERFKRAGHWPKLLMVGDFLQLPPVTGQKLFESIDWDACHTLKLTAQHRQFDQDFIDVLNDIRVGNLSDRAMGLVRSRTYPDLPDACTHLMSYRYKVKNRNEKKLAELPGAVWTSKMEVVTPPVRNLWDEPTCPSMDKLERSRFPHYLNLKKNARVVLLTNEPSGLWVNGSTGEVVGFPGNAVSVLLDRGGTVTITRTQEEILEPDGRTLCWIEQYPMQLAWALTIHKCVSGDTLIPTGGGLQRISEIAKDVPKGAYHECQLKVFGLKGEKVATQIFHGNIEKTIKLSTQKGFELEGSYRHPILCCTQKGLKWKKLPDVQVGDCVIISPATDTQKRYVSTNKYGAKACFQSEKKSSIPLIVDEDLGYALGTLVGDGNYSDSTDGRVEIGAKDTETITSVASVIENAFSTNCTKRNPEGKIPSMYFCRKNVRSFLEWAGLPYVKAKDKSIPWTVMCSPASVQAAFLQGLYDTDGGINASSIHLTSTSERLLKEVQLILLNFGIIGRRYLIREATENCNTAWRIDVCGRSSVRFFKKISFGCLRKACLLKRQYGKYKTCTPKANSGFIPFGREAMRRLREMLREVHGRRFLGKAKDADYGFFSRVIYGTSNLSTEHLLHLCALVPNMESYGDLFAQLKTLGKAGAYVDVITKKETRKSEMYDLYVPDGHDFMGNGFVNHNSQGMTMDKVGVDLEGHFAPGQTYVALSRCRTKEGLFLTGQLKRLFVDPSALKHCG